MNDFFFSVYFSASKLGDPVFLNLCVVAYIYLFVYVEKFLHLGRIPLGHSDYSFWCIPEFTFKIFVENFLGYVYLRSLPPPPFWSQGDVGIMKRSSMSSFYFLEYKLFIIKTGINTHLSITQYKLSQSPPQRHKLKEMKGKKKKGVCCATIFVDSFTDRMFCVDSYSHSGSQVSSSQPVGHACHRGNISDILHAYLNVLSGPVCSPANEIISSLWMD